MASSRDTLTKGLFVLGVPALHGQFLAPVLLIINMQPSIPDSRILFASVTLIRRTGAEPISQHAPVSGYEGSRKGYSHVLLVAIFFLQA